MCTLKLKTSERAESFKSIDDGFKIDQFTETQFGMQSVQDSYPKYSRPPKIPLRNL
jgi:hypothetical protein